METIEGAKESPDLAVGIGSLALKNPVIAASGTFGYGKEYSGLVDVAALGGVCTKGLTLAPRTGNRGIRLHETPAGLMNSIGLENPGIPAFIERELPGLRKMGATVIANLSGGSLEEYVEGAALLSSPAAEGVAAIELNISCPNVKAGGMAFGLEPGPAAEVVTAVRSRTPMPLIVKLSPNAPDLVAVARACEAAGADALSLVNTFKALAIDVWKRRPIFDNVTAGLSGPAIRPIALRMVWELAGAVGIPLIGMGGIESAQDALEFILAGASAVEIGSATFRDPTTMETIIRGLREYLATEKISRMSELIGAARAPSRSAAACSTPARKAR